MRNDYKLRNAVDRYRRVGFTLIELLIVIAIIALLAMILFPVFARAREGARRASCSSDLRQIALGMQQYVKDCDDRYPNVIQTINDGTRWYGLGWAQMLSPYVKNTQIFQCPSERFLQNPHIKSASQPTYFWPNYSDYFYNLNIAQTQLAVNTSSFDPIGIQESVLSNPPLTILLGDTWNEGSGASQNMPVAYEGEEITLDANGEYASSNFTPGSLAMERHLEGANYALADGHIKWYKHTAIARGYQGLFPGWRYSEPHPGTLGNARPPDSLGPYAVTFAPY